MAQKLGLDDEIPGCSETGDVPQTLNRVARDYERRWNALCHKIVDQIERLWKEEHSG